MISYISQALQNPSLYLPSAISGSELLVDQSVSLFGDLFSPKADSEYSEFLDCPVPEFDLDGYFQEAVQTVYAETSAPGSRKLSNELASTQANENSGSELESSASISCEGSSTKDQLNLDTQSILSTTSSSLKKRPSRDQVPSLQSAESQPQGEFFSEYDQQTFTRAKLVSLVIRLIDREALPESQVSCLDSESLKLLSNFSFMIYSQTVSVEKLQDDLESLNFKISTTSEKKKRNEERIKYVFKRVNKILLKAFMDQNDLPQEAEDKATKQIIHKYFGSAICDKEGSKKSQEVYDRYFTLLFKPSNMYRNDLKDVFSFPSYLQMFKSILETEFLAEFKDKRQAKVKTYLNDLRTEVFYSNDKADPSILQKKVSRLPWSLAEVRKGIDLFELHFKAM
jgi:hypothetical protein